MSNRWSVKKVGSYWQVLDGKVLYDSFLTLEEAHTFATQQAVCDYLYEPGGLTHLKTLQKSFAVLQQIRDEERLSLL